MPFIVRKVHIPKGPAKDVWVRNYKSYDKDDNNNENTLFDHNIPIEITIYKQFR